MDVGVLIPPTDAKLFFLKIVNLFPLQIARSSYFSNDLQAFGYPERTLFATLESPGAGELGKP